MSHKKSILMSFALVLLIVGGLGSIKVLQFRGLMSAAEMQMPPTTVNSTTVTEALWPRELMTVGELEAVQGVIVASEEVGKVVNIAFESGRDIQQGDLLVQQDILVESAELKSAEAAFEIAKINYQRSQKLIKNKTIARSDFDNDRSRYLQAQADLQTIRARIQRKTITAPFEGRLGVRQINVGQVIQPMDPIVSLQKIDPIYVNFAVPQKAVAKIKLGQKVVVSGDMLSGHQLDSQITAISPEVNAVTRQIQLQATLNNHAHLLRPGMFVDVALEISAPETVLMIPTTAVLYATYGNSVFLIEEQSLKQVFVQLGQKRGDFVQVVKGLEAGEQVVSTGVFKLFNGMSVDVDNQLQPDFQQTPSPEDA